MCFCCVCEWYASERKSQIMAIATNGVRLVDFGRLDQCSGCVRPFAAIAATSRPTERLASGPVWSLGAKNLWIAIHTKTSDCGTVCSTVDSKAKSIIPKVFRKYSKSIANRCLLLCVTVLPQQCLDSSSIRATLECLCGSELSNHPDGRVCMRICCAPFRKWWPL